MSDTPNQSPEARSPWPPLPDQPPEGDAEALKREENALAAANPSALH